MAFETELRDEAGRTVARFWTGIERSYVLPDGRRCAVPQAGAWCPNCRAFVAAQEVPSLEHVDQRLVALRAGPEAFVAWVGACGEWIDEEDCAGEGWERYQKLEIRYWEDVRTWRQLRQSPPRCLECFSTEVKLIPDRVEFTYHPLTRQRLTLDTSCHMTLSRRWTYSPEGLPLETARGSIKGKLGA